MDFTRLFLISAIRTFIVPVIFLLFIIINCAEIASPPGGEIDRTSPFLVSSVPANGAVNVEPDNLITIYFSERIVKPLAKKPVFISPRLKEEPRVKWKSDHIIITLPDSFAFNQTYIISVSSEIKDLRNNSLDSSTIIAFSTGPSIDSGEIAGNIYIDNKPQKGMLVALYELALFNDTLPIDSIYPDYITQSNKDGFFSFQYLPEKEYRMVAFTDLNQNEQFNPNREKYALPDRPVKIGGELLLDNLILPVARQDTISPEIISAAFTGDKLIRIRLSKEIDLDLLKQNPSNFLLKSLKDTNRVIPAYAILESNKDTASTIHMYAGELSEDSYQLELFYNLDKAPLYYKELIVKTIEDSNHPKIVDFNPDNNPQFLDQLIIEASFSEPIDTAYITDETFTLWDKNNDQVLVTYRWLDPLRVKFKSDNLNAGMSYRLLFTEFEIADYAGNVMGDSLREYNINLIDSDSLGTISGEIEIMIENKKNDPVVLNFRNIENKQLFNLPVSDRTFNYNLPGGRYILSGFIDSDFDGERGKGSIFPYRFSETTATYPDTISVRARFETAGIIFEFK